MKLLIAIIYTVFSFSVFAQHTSLIFSNPVGVHGGLVGNAGYDRVGSSHGFYKSKGGVDSTQYGVYTYPFRLGHHNSVNYDFLSKKLKGGIGVSLNYYSSFQSYTSSKTVVRNETTLFNGVYKERESYFVNNEAKQEGLDFSVVYSPKFIVKQTVAFSPFYRIGYSYNKLEKYTKRIDNNEIETQEINSISNELLIDRVQLGGGPKKTITQDIGFLFNKDKWMIGYTMSGLDYNINKLDYYKNFKPLEKLTHRFIVGKFFSFTKDDKFGLNIILENEIRYEASNRGSLEIYGGKPVFSYYNISQLNASIKLSKLTLGLGMSGFYGQYEIKEKIKIGYSIYPWYQNEQQIGFQYIFKKDEEEEKLFSVPLKN